MSSYVLALSFDGVLCPRQARDNINFCLCAIFDNASPYTRSKFSNNHHLYRDTMPLIES